MQLHAPGQAHRLAQPGVGGTAAVVDVRVRRDAALAFGVALLAVGGGGEFQFDHALVARAHQRQQAMRGDLRDRLDVVEIVAELGALALLAGDHLRADLSLRPQPVAQLTDQMRVFGDGFHQDGARAVQRGAHVGHALVRIDERLGERLRRERGILAQAGRQRFQPGLAGDLRLGAALGLERQVQVLQSRLGVGGEQVGFQCIIELALFLDAGQDRRAALFQFTQVAQALLQQAQLGVVEAAGDLLAVARDERHGGAAVEKIHRRAHLFGPGGDVVGNALFDAEHGWGAFLAAARCRRMKRSSRR